MTSTTTPRTDVAMLNEGDFIAQGQVVSVSRPRTDYPFTTPATVWEVEYVESPEADAPVLRTRMAAGTMVEAW